MFSRAVLFVIFLALTPSSQAQSLCRNIFQASPPLGSLAPVPQLFQWEHANLPQFRESIAPVWLDMPIAPHNKIETFTVGAIGQNVLSYFRKVPGFFWPKHPLNTDTTVPYSTKERVGVLKAFWTASRSFYFFIGSGLHSVKPPTNQTHTLAPAEPGKTEMTSTQLQLNRSRVIEERDTVLPESAYVRILHDVAAVVDKSTGSGFLVRDLTPLQDGNYYLPAFAIPYVGQQIASRFGQSFDAFWGQHYAQPVGRAKAELLLRYGFVLTSPHPQNLIIQLNPQFYPTGKIFVRDISDSVYVEQAAYALGLQSAVRLDITNDRQVISFTDINSQNSFSRLDEAGLSPNLLKQWEAQHDQAYIDHMVSALKLDPAKYNQFYDVVSLFNTQSGVEALQRYDTALRAQ